MTNTPSNDTPDKDRRIRELESHVKALAALLESTGMTATELSSGDEPTDVTVVHLREMVAEARGKQSTEQFITRARHDLRRVAEARSPIDRGAHALCLAAHALIIYEIANRQAKT